jgi:excisionase family DNA binding protein
MNTSMPRDEELLTTQEAADMLGVSARRIRQAIAEGQLKAAKVGPQWIISEKAVKDFDKKRRPVGRPSMDKSAA